MDFVAVVGVQELLRAIVVEHHLSCHLLQGPQSFQSEESHVVLLVTLGLADHFKKFLLAVLYRVAHLAELALQLLSG